MKISGRNKLRATVKQVVKGAVMAKVVMDYKGDELIAAITVDSVEDLDIKPGDEVTALVKATEMRVLEELLFLPVISFQVNIHCIKKTPIKNRRLLT